MSSAFSFLNFRNGTAIILAACLLTACDEQGDFVAMKAFEPKNTEVQNSANARSTAETTGDDIEAPDAFFASEAGLWDGRPSLGGVWVAHPDVNEPERVIIRNADNDTFVVGALFRRERNFPGPRLQISSDAAEALGMLAGAPADLTVTALRKQAVADVPDTAVGTRLAPDAIAATSLEPVSDTDTALHTSQTQAADTSPAEQIQPVAVDVPTLDAASASTISKPYVQIGIFSVEENADRTAEQMARGGIAPTLRTFERDGTQYWRVLAGPAETETAHRQLLTKVKAEGYTDAYAVTN